MKRSIYIGIVLALLPFYGFAKSPTEIFKGIDALLGNMPLTLEKLKDRLDKKSYATKSLGQGRYEYSFHLVYFYDVRVNGARFYIDSDKQVFELGMDRSVCLSIAEVTRRYPSLRLRRNGYGNDLREAYYSMSSRSGSFGVSTRASSDCVSRFVFEDYLDNRSSSSHRDRDDRSNRRHSGNRRR